MLTFDLTVFRLAQENEVKSAQSKIRETQKENDELMRQLAKKERECEVKTQEKDELMQVRSQQLTTSML